MLPPPTTDIRMACFICSQLVDPRAPNFLIECHFCGRWLHGACAQVTEQDALLITKFACVDCRQQQHQTEKYQQPNNASNAPYDADALSYAPLPVHLSGYASEPARLRHKKNSASFRRLLGAAIYARSGVHLVPSQDLTPSFLQRNALDEPVLIAGGSHNIAGLNEAFPVIDAATVTELLAKNHSVRTTDVATQTRQQLTSAAWQSEISEAEQQENQLTLPNAEFRLLRTPLQSKVDAPVAVTQVDWHNLLPNNDDGSGSTGNATNPNVFGVFLGANAYLDFVVAPGGQCTWLSVTGGELWVYLIPPTKENTVAFRDWKSDPDFATAFLPEKTEKCIKDISRVQQRWKRSLVRCCWNYVMTS
ncbi:JmjC domain-containing histone demethylation protein 1 [Phytophthora boehmeriae]|uniref:JmjC domain-containing histone demethylation protein 1 n=1 Tax=Phytophthora boehmeriae TaxID=109152 RepID=A0A8T1VZJ1_9STRA|nr:JmjC domain-containing histone demethylation protein 1 [Phytophthora boehmeriae]